MKIPERNTSGYLSCNDDTVLQFYRTSIRCCSHVWLAGLHAGLQLVVPKKPLPISRGHCCNRWCNSLFSWSGKVVLLKTTIPLHTGYALSDYPLGAKVSKILPGWCWSHPGRPTQARHREPCQPPQQCPSVLSSTSWSVGFFRNRCFCSIFLQALKHLCRVRIALVQPRSAWGHNPAASSLCVLWIHCGNAAIDNSHSRIRKFLLFI